MGKYDIEVIEGELPRFWPYVNPKISLDTAYPQSVVELKLRANNTNDLLCRVQTAKEKGIASYFHYRNPDTLANDKMLIFTAQKEATEFGDILILQLVVPE